MTALNPSRMIHFSSTAREMTAARASWVLFTCVMLGFLWFGGQTLLDSFLIALGAAFPVLLHMAISRYSTKTADELEMAAWVVVVMLGAALSGGLSSPVLIGFVLPIMSALAIGNRRLAMEASAFSVLGFILAGFLDLAQFGRSQPEFLNTASVWFAFFTLIYFVLLVRLSPIAVNMVALVRRLQQEVRVGSEQSGDVISKAQAKINNAERRAQLAEEKAEQLADQLAKAQEQVDQRTRFFAQTSHELRTPLNAILGFSEIMKDGLYGPLPEKYLEYAHLIHEGGCSLQLIVDDVLDLSKAESGQYKIYPEKVSLTEIAWDSMRFMADQARRRNIRIGFGKRDDVEAVADARAVRQIILNLISNAIKFTPENGAVVIAVSRVEGGANVSVRDTGPGLSQEEFEQLLKPFVQGDEKAQLKPKGTGLGLSIANALAKLHGGDLILEADTQAGSVISLFLPSTLDDKKQKGDFELLDDDDDLVGGKSD